jgi:hypothetical protein
LLIASCFHIYRLFWTKLESTRLRSATL